MLLITVVTTLKQSPTDFRCHGTSAVMGRCWICGSSSTRTPLILSGCGATDAIATVLPHCDCDAD